MEPEIPRVHEVLNILYPQGWYNEGDLERGARQHKETSDLLLGKIKQSEVTDTRVLLLYEWCLAQRLSPLCAEIPLHSVEYGFYGHPDLIGQVKGQTRGYDWKFSESLTESNYMQIEAYRIFRPTIPWYMVQIPRDGDIKAVKVKPNPYFRAVFIAGVTLWKWRKKKGQLG